MLAFSALVTLLVGRQEENQACKNWMMRCWHGYMSGARCKSHPGSPGKLTFYRPEIACHHAGPSGQTLTQ